MCRLAYDVWDDGTRCAARSHPGVAHKRRASDSVVTMLDTYDALQWESKDCDDDDAEIIGTFSSDEEADGEDSEKGAADDADDESAGEVSLSAETVDLLKSHGKCKSNRRGWKIVPKDEAAELIQAVDGKGDSGRGSSCTPGTNIAGEKAPSPSQEAPLPTGTRSSSLSNAGTPVPFLSGVSLRTG
jgi:hypothetical protein